MLDDSLTPLHPHTKTVLDEIQSLIGEGLLEGRYDLLGVLDTGGLGIIVKARDSVINREVALKFLRPAYVGKQDLRAAFAREAQQVGAVDKHENIVSLYDARLGSDLPYLVLELIDGVGLDQVMKERLDPERVIDITIEILSALEYAHDRGVCHGDLKPRNILLTKQGRVKVLDFGFAVAVEGSPGQQSSATLFHAHTKRYSSPEYLQVASATPQTDIFSMGVIIHEFLADGAHPYGDQYGEGDAPISECTEIEPKLAENIDSRLRETIRRCVAWKTKDRFTTVRELRNALSVDKMPPPAPVLRPEHFVGKCLVCGESQGDFQWSPSSRLCQKSGCVQPHLFRGAEDSDETLLVSVMPEWKVDLDLEALPSINRSSPNDIFALEPDGFPGACQGALQGEELGIGRYLPYSQDFLAEVCGVRCGNALCYRLPRIAYAAHLDEIFVLDFSSYRWSGTLKDPRSWAIVNVAVERGVQHLAAWTAGNAGLSLARICQLANHWLPRSRRIRSYALHGPGDGVDDAIRFQLRQAGATVIETASNEVFAPTMIERNVRLHAEVDGRWSRDRFWDVSDGWEGVGLVIYRLILAQVLRDLKPEVVLVPVGTGNLAVGTVLAARDLGQIGLQPRVVGVVPHGDNVLQQLDALMRTSVRRPLREIAKSRPLMPKLESTYTPLLACINHLCRTDLLEIIEVDRKQQENALSNLFRVRVPWIAAEPSSVAAFAAIPDVVKRRGKKRVLVVNSGAGVLSRAEQEFMSQFFR